MWGGVYTMHDFVREIMGAWTEEGPQAAYDLADQLLAEIDSQSRRLAKQAEAIKALESHLLESGDVKERKPVLVGPGLDVVEPSERPRLITDAALRHLSGRSGTVTGDEVLMKLAEQGLDLGVKQPYAVVGTVLAQADNFTRIARNTFEYEDPNPEDLPW